MADPYVNEYLWYERTTGEVIRLVDVQDGIVVYIDESGVIAQKDEAEFYKKYEGVPPTDPPKPPMERGWQTKYAQVAPVVPRIQLVSQWSPHYVSLEDFTDVHDVKDACDAGGDSDV